MSWDVFISYSHTPCDETMADWLNAFLKTNHKLVWFDKEALTKYSGGDLNEETSEAIKTCRLVVALISSQFLASSYCQAELIYAMALGKKILQLDVDEVSAYPERLMPLAGHITERENLAALAGTNRLDKLAFVFGKCGIFLQQLTDTPFEFHPAVNTIRPNYSRLRQCDAATLNSLIHRLKQAEILNPKNGYTQLSLAFVWISQHDAINAQEAATCAVRQLPDEPNARYALALAECIETSVGNRSKDQTDSILRHLARARRLPFYGVHIDLLSALVLANYYLRHHLSRPIEPEAFLTKKDGCIYEAEECDRVLDVEPLHKSLEETPLNHHIGRIHPRIIRTQ